MTQVPPFDMLEALKVAMVHVGHDLDPSCREQLVGQCVLAAHQQAMREAQERVGELELANERGMQAMQALEARVRELENERGMICYWFWPEGDETPVQAAKRARERAERLQEERDSIIKALGCHPAHILDEIGQLSERADSQPNSDQYRQLREEVEQLKAKYDELHDQRCAEARKVDEQRATIERLRQHLAIMGGTLQEDGTLVVESKKYNASHACDEHRKNWKAEAAFEECNLCLQQTIEALAAALRAVK